MLSTFGVMFSPDQAKAASELARVCRPGGRIGLANWTPEGFIGQMFKTLGAICRRRRACSRRRAGASRRICMRSSATHAAAIAVTPRVFNFRYRSAAHFIDVFRTWYGPVHKAFAALPADSALALERDLTELLNRMNRGGTAALVVPSEYVEVIVRRA